MGNDDFLVPLETRKKSLIRAPSPQRGSARPQPFSLACQCCAPAESLHRPRSQHVRARGAAQVRTVRRDALAQIVNSSGLVRPAAEFKRKRGRKMNK